MSRVRGNDGKNGGHGPPYDSAGSGFASANKLSTLLRPVGADNLAYETLFDCKLPTSVGANPGGAATRPFTWSKAYWKYNFLDYQATEQKTATRSAAESPERKVNILPEN